MNKVLEIHKLYAETFIELISFRSTLLKVFEE